MFPRECCFIFSADLRGRHVRAPTNSGKIFWLYSIPYIWHILKVLRNVIRQAHD